MTVFEGHVQILTEDLELITDIKSTPFKTPQEARDWNVKILANLDKHVPTWVTKTKYVEFCFIVRHFEGY